jgi:hypothetical protein
MHYRNSTIKLLATSFSGFNGDSSMEYRVCKPYKSHFHWSIKKSCSQNRLWKKRINRGFQTCNQGFIYKKNRQISGSIFNNFSFFKFTFIFCSTMAKQEDLFKNVVSHAKEYGYFFRQAKYTMV